MKRPYIAWLFLGIMLVVVFVTINPVTSIAQDIYGDNKLALIAMLFWPLFAAMCAGDVIAGGGVKRNGKWTTWIGVFGLTAYLLYAAIGQQPASAVASQPGLARPSTGWVAQPAATTQAQPTALPTIAPVVVPVAQPETNGADVGVVAVDALDKALEREQGQNAALVSRADNLLLVVVLVMIGFAALVIIISRLSGRRNSQPDPQISIAQPVAKELKPGEYFSVNGQIFQVPQNNSKQITGRN